jgi:hypothetical protein
MLGALMERGLFTIVRFGVVGKDPLGKPLRAVVSSTVVDGRLEQTRTVEASEDALVVNSYRAFMPAGTDLRAGDEVRARGQRFTVEGAPAVGGISGFPALTNVAAVLKYVGPVA